MTVSECARKWRVSTTCVYAWLKSGRLVNVSKDAGHLEISDSSVRPEKRRPGVKATGRRSKIG